MKRAVTSLHSRGTSELVEEGNRLIEALDAVQDRSTAVQEWKRMLEEPAARAHATAIWAALRQRSRAKSTPYGVLVATAGGARKILCDSGKHFSVREYWVRLCSTMGEHYLGIDHELGRLLSDPANGRDARYEQRLEEVHYPELSSAANEYLASLKSRAFEEARRNAMNFIARQPASHGQSSQGRRTIRLKELAQVVVGRVAQKLIGMPLELRSDDELTKFLGNFVTIHHYCFQPYPDHQLAHAAQASGEQLQSAYRDQRPLQGEMASYVRQSIANDQLPIRQAMMGAIVGFAAPAIESACTVIEEWGQTGELGRLSRLCEGLDGAKRRAALMEALLEALVHAPAPPILYRTALEGAEVDGMRVEPGRLVVVGLHSACVDARSRGSDEPWQWIFGGARGGLRDPSSARHGCPARPAAVDVLVGMLTALFDTQGLKWDSPFVLSCDA